MENNSAKKWIVLFCVTPSKCAHAKHDQRRLSKAQFILKKGPAVSRLNLTNSQESYTGRMMKTLVLEIVEVSRI